MAIYRSSVELVLEQIPYHSVILMMDQQQIKREGERILHQFLEFNQKLPSMEAYRLFQYSTHHTTIKYAAAAALNLFCSQKAVFRRSRFVYQARSAPFLGCYGYTGLWCVQIGQHFLHVVVRVVFFNYQTKRTRGSK